MTTSVNLSFAAPPTRESRQPGAASTSGSGDFARILYGASRDVRAKLASRPENSAAQMFRQAEPEQSAEPADETKTEEAPPTTRARVEALRTERERPAPANNQRQTSAQRERVDNTAQGSSNQGSTPQDADRASETSATPWQQELRQDPPSNVPVAQPAVAMNNAAPVNVAVAAAPANPAAAIAQWFRAQLPLARPSNAPGVALLADRPQSPATSSARSAPKPETPVPQKSNTEHDGADGVLPSELSKWISAMRLRHSAGESRAEIDLTPPELGRMRVSLSLDGDDLRVEVQTETDEAGAAVRSQLDRLRSALERLGVRVAQLDVQTAAIKQTAGGEPIAPVGSDTPQPRDAGTTAARRRESGSRHARDRAWRQPADEETDVRV